MRTVIEAHELLPTSLQLESLSIETEGVIPFRAIDVTTPPQHPPTRSSQ